MAYQPPVHPQRLGRVPGTRQGDSSNDGSGRSPRFQGFGQLPRQNDSSDAGSGRPREPHTGGLPSSGPRPAHMGPRRFGRGLHFGSQGFGPRPRQGNSSNDGSGRPPRFQGFGQLARQNDSSNVGSGQLPRFQGFGQLARQNDNSNDGSGRPPRFQGFGQLARQNDNSPHGLPLSGHAPAHQVPGRSGQSLRPVAGSQDASRVPGGVPACSGGDISSGRLPSSQPATNPREIRPQGQRSQPTSLRRQYDESNKRKRPGGNLKEDTFTGGWMVTLKKRLNIGADIDPAALRNSMEVPCWGSRQGDVAMSEVDTPMPTASAGLPGSATSAPTQPPVATCLSDNPASRIGVLPTNSREHCQQRNTPCMVYGCEASASVPAASERGRQ